VSAEGAALHMLPPTVATLRICLEPILLAASVNAEYRFWMNSFPAMSLCVTPPPICKPSPMSPSPMSIDEKPMYYECKARSLDRITGSATEVIYRQAKVIKRRDGSHWENPHAFMICQSKAKRNAIAELLPQALIRGWMNDYEATKTFDGKRAEAFHEKPTPPKLADFNVEDAIEQISSCVAADIKTLTAVYTECWKACPKADRPQIEEAYRLAKVALMPEREPGIDE